MSDIESLWRTMIKDIFKKGHLHTKDDKQIKEILNVSGWVDNPLMEIAPNHSIFSKEKYIEFLQQGTFNIEGYNIKNEALAEYVESLDDESMIGINKNSDFVYTYPQRLQNINLCDKESMPTFFDQIEIMCERLKKNKGSNRAVATLYSAGLDKDEEHIPCLNWMQALIRDDKLFLSVMFRSNDIYNAFPSNMYFISYIGLTITDALQEYYPTLSFDGIYYQCSSAHYYVDEINDEIIEKIIGD